MILRNITALTGLALLCLLAVSGCAMTPPPQAIHTLAAPPATAYRTLGMVSGQGPNIPAATAHARQQAANMGADAVIMGHQHKIAPNNWVVSVKAIKYTAPPAGAGQPAPGAPAPAAAPPY